MAYGSNLNLEQMARLCENPKIICKSKLKDHQILFRGEHDRAFLNIEQKKDSDVPVLVWEISHEDEKNLDELEEYPVLYRKEYIELDVNGVKMKAMAYVMNGENPLGKPSNRYYNTVLEGYKTAGFDINILEKALKTSVKVN